MSKHTNPTTRNERILNQLTALRANLDTLLDMIEVTIDELDCLARLVNDPLKSGEYILHYDGIQTPVTLFVDIHGECVSIKDDDGKELLIVATEHGLWDKDNPNCYITK